VVAPARSRGCDGRRAGGVVHRGQRGRLSRFSEFRLAGRARLYPLGQVVASITTNRSSCRFRLV